MPAVVTMAALALLGVVTFVIGDAQLDAARQARLDDRTHLVSRFARAGAQLYDHLPLVEHAAALPFSPDDPARTEALLPYFGLTPSSDPYLEVVALRADGSVVAALPTGADPSRYHLDGALEDALAHGWGLSPVFTLEDHLVWARTIPLGGDRPWGALVLVEDLEDRWMQQLYQGLGALGRGHGGLSLVDQHGVAAASWDPDLAGTRLLDADERARITDQVSVWSTDREGETVVNVGVARHGVHRSTALLFQQSESALYGDLVSAQADRDRITFAALVASMAVLILFAQLRQRATRRAERRAAAVLDAIDDIIVMLDRHDRISSISSGLVRNLDLEAEPWVGRPLVDLAHPDHRHHVAEAISTARTDGLTRELGVALLHRDATPRWFDVTVTDRRDDRHVGGLIVTCTPIGDRKALEDELFHRARHDTLTGLPNRSGFEAALAEVAEQGRPSVVGVIDLDRFKPLNDQLGHAAGDRALRAVAEVVEAALGPHGSAARLGGDEFGFVLHDLRPGLSDEVCRRIITEVEAVWPGTETTPGLSATIGAISVEGPLVSPEATVRQADAVMYRAKAAGGARFVVEPTKGPVHPRPSTPVDHHHRIAAPRPGVDPLVPLVDHHRAPLRLHQRLRRGAPLLLAVVVVMSVLTVTAVLSARSMRAAEQIRLDERYQVLDALAELTVRTTDPERLVLLAAATPWDPADPATTEEVLDHWVLTPAVGADGIAALVDRSGRVLASSPRGIVLPEGSTSGHDRWEQVLDGAVHIPPLAHDGDELRLYWNLPVVRHRQVTEVLVLGATVAHAPWVDVLQNFGSLGEDPGGAVVVDGNGVVASSWHAADVGTVLIEPEQLRAAGSSSAVLHGDGPQARSTLVRRLSDPYSERYVLWQEQPGALFGDLHRGRRATDLTLAAVVTLVLLGVGWVHRRREHQLRRNEGRLDALLRHSTTVVLIVDRLGIVDYASSAVTRYTGRPAGESCGAPLSDAIGGDAAATVLARCRSLGRQERIEVDRVPLVDHTGAPRVVDVVVQDVHHRPEVGGCLISLHDRTDRQHLEDQLALAARHDPLTGLLNRSAFAEELEALHADRRSAEDPYAVVFIDLDHFKPVNDDHGHHVGDQVLVVLSRRLEAAVRAKDLVARHGGDEFTVLLRHCDQAHAEATIERLLAAVRSPIEVGDVVVQVGASAGVVLGVADPRQAGSSVVRDADHAMYEAKQGGRGGWILAGR